MKKINNTARKMPELLAPAGSPEALRAAIESGADAIYMGGAEFNARINARNFTDEQLKDGIALAHAYGTKIYITLNTLALDCEAQALLKTAERLFLYGADALIVADMGLAAEIKKRIPIELHASTQMSGHNVAMAELLEKSGFSRMVCAREMSRDDLREFCLRSPIEAEVFVHGALCVSTSGQCLFSSIVGGRSGNRGECAQPCRLPYGKSKKSYPLSLSDLSLATHITELADMGVASFKIEGRMKSPEYVRDVVAIWRHLLDEGRNAGKEEMEALASIFSRGGFTDGYYVGRKDSSMLGVRSSEDKKQTAELSPFAGITRKIPLRMSAEIRSGEYSRLTVSACGRTASVSGAMPEAARNMPLSRDTVIRNLSKLGGTPYCLESLELDLDEGLMMPLSTLNTLRRVAIQGLSPSFGRSEADIKRDIPEKKEEKADRGERKPCRSAVFYDPRIIPSEAFEYFDRIFIPLEAYKEYGKRGMGVMLPETVFDSQQAKVRELLRNALDLGAKDALVENAGHIGLAKELGFRLHGDFRMNIANSSTARVVKEMGFESIILSPELTLPQLRDINKNTSGCMVTVYGRLPLMLTEKCIGKELGGCNSCMEGRQSLTDRRGVEFPVRMRYGHRSILFNSVPTYMADRAEELSRNGITGLHFIFTAENNGSEAASVIKAYKTSAPPADPAAVRRVRSK